MTVKELFLSGLEMYASYMIYNEHGANEPMTPELYERFADRTIMYWYLLKDETAESGAHIVIKLEEE